MNGDLGIGVDVGGTKVLGVVADESGNVLDDFRLPTPRGTTALIATIGDVVEELQSRLEASRSEKSRFLGVGVPGSIDHSGVITTSPNLPGVTMAPVRDLLAARLGPDIQIKVDNDANCAVWAERLYGAGRNAEELLMVTLGTGIGGGIVTGGRLLRGTKGFAGEIGHVIINVNGPPCVCGQRGCWERYASGSGLGRLAREAAYANPRSRIVELAGGDPDDVKGEHVTAAAAEADPVAASVMEQFAWWLAVGLSNLVNTLDPEMIVLGGGITESGPVLLNPARAAFASLFYGSEIRGVLPIELAVLGERTNALGAASLRKGAA